MNQTKSNSLKNRTEYEYGGAVYYLIPLPAPGSGDNCRYCDLIESQGCTEAPCRDGVFKSVDAIPELIRAISYLLDVASFETEGSVTTAYIPLHYSGIMDDVLEMMKIKATMGTFKDKSSFLRAYNIHTSDFKRICEKH